jgi:hypothetical protein
MGKIPLKPPPFPDKLPFEGTVGRALLKVTQSVDNFPPIKAVNGLVDKLPYFPAQKMGTPFGNVTLPELILPKIKAPEMTEGHKAALKASIGRDVAGAIEFIPAVGPLIAEPISDTFLGQINDSLTAEEFKTYLGWEKKSPWSILALLQTIRRK